MPYFRMVIESMNFTMPTVLQTGPLMIQPRMAMPPLCVGLLEILVAAAAGEPRRELVVGVFAVAGGRQKAVVATVVRHIDDGVGQEDGGAEEGHVDDDGHDQYFVQSRHD